MSIKKLMITGLVVAMLNGTLFNDGNQAFAKQPNSQSTQSIKINELSPKYATELAFRLAKITSYIQSGGKYKEGEYKTFTYKGKTYRYLSSDIDQKKELKAYLQRALTPAAAEQFIKNIGIIEYKGKMAQPEADGGSLLQWHKATATFVRAEKNTRFYRLSVPLGASTTKQVYMIEYQYAGKLGWRINQQPYWDLEIPFNIHPVRNLFHMLIAQPEVAQQQFMDPSTLKVAEFRKGVKTVELRELKEVARTKTQVEYVAVVDVELEESYKGSLNKGLNQFYFLIQPVDEMEFKIASMGTGPHLVK